MSFDSFDWSFEARDSGQQSSRIAINDVLSLPPASLAQ